VNTVIRFKLLKMRGVSYLADQIFSLQKKKDFFPLNLFRRVHCEDLQKRVHCFGQGLLARPSKIKFYTGEPHVCCPIRASFCLNMRKINISMKKYFQFCAYLERNSLERKLLEGLSTEKCNTCIVSSKRYLYVLQLLKFFVSNQQSQYTVFHELMCWQSLTFRLPNVMSPLQRGDLLYNFSGLMRGFKPKFY
jgi:hypothetical protein